MLFAVCRLFRDFHISENTGGYLKKRMSIFQVASGIFGQPLTTPGGV